MSKKSVAARIDKLVDALNRFVEKEGLDTSLQEIVLTFKDEVLHFQVNHTDERGKPVLKARKR